MGENTELRGSIKNDKKITYKFNDTEAYQATDTSKSKTSETSGLH